jgi:exodeoxyribonuclease-3
VYSRSSEGKCTISRWSTPPIRGYRDYTQLRFPRREGMRIDFVLGSPALAARALIDREERKGKGASDHALVIVDLAD